MRIIWSGTRILPAWLRTWAPGCPRPRVANRWASLTRWAQRHACPPPNSCTRLLPRSSRCTDSLYLARPKTPPPALRIFPPANRLITDLRMLKKTCSCVYLYHHCFEAFTGTFNWLKLRKYKFWNYAVFLENVPYQKSTKKTKRVPVRYRILFHHRVADKWNI